MTVQDTKIDKVVVVIHGVGDPPAGGTLNRFARSLASDEDPLVEQQTTLWLGERSSVPDRTSTFPTAIRQISFGDSRCELAEVFWGDLSQVKRGTLGLIYGLFQVLFGLRYVAYVAADQPGRAAKYLKMLGLISAKVLHGPVLATTVFLAMITAAALGTDLMWPGSYRDIAWTEVLLGGCACVAVVASILGRRITRSRVVMRFWNWLNIVAVWAVLLMIVKALWIDHAFPEINCLDCAHPGLVWFGRVFVVLLGLMWFAESAVVIAMGVCWFCAWAHRRTYRPAINLGFLLPALAVGIWGQALPMVWVTASEAISKTNRVPELVAAFDEALPLLGVQFLMLVITAMGATLVLGQYFIWRWRNNVSTFLQGSRPPRLIIHTLQQRLLGACTAVGASLVFVLCSMNILGYPFAHSPLGRTLLEINKYAVVLMVPLGGLSILVLPYLRPGFDILLDVVNHFYFRATNIEDALDDDDEFDIQETTFSSGSLFFSRRDMIHSRIKKILVYYRERLSHRPQLVIVSHSQGTMVAVEILNDPEMAWLNSSFSKTTLVTMGSPLTHLYQHYFGHLYPALNEPFWDEFRNRVDRWLNLFRVDDFVGRQVDFPIVTDSQKSQTASTSGNTHLMSGFGSTGPDCSEHPLGPRGHVNYWQDSEALAVIREEISADAEYSNQGAAPTIHRAA